MAHLREYEYKEEIPFLVLFFYWDSNDSYPALIIRCNPDTLHLSVTRYKCCVSRLCIAQEVEKLLLLLDEPYWKSFVKCTASREHRVRNYELF